MKIPRGWYMPVDEEPEESDAPLWNPYWHDGAGNWIEAQTEGHVEVMFPDEIMFPIAPLVLAGPVIKGADTERGSSDLG